MIINDVNLDFLKEMGVFQYTFNHYTDGTETLRLQIAGQTGTVLIHVDILFTKVSLIGVINKAKKALQGK